MVLVITTPKRRVGEKILIAVIAFFVFACLLGILAIYFSDTSSLPQKPAKPDTITNLH